jgi:hypothetical protein
MSDRSDSPGHGHGTGCAHPQTGASTDQARTGRHLRLVEKAPAEPAAAENTSSSRKSHLARLVEALHASRRIQAAHLTRRYLHLVQ